MKVDTIEKSHMVFRALWSWLSKTGRHKVDWPGWMENGGKVADCQSYCPFCEYTFHMCINCKDVGCPCARWPVKSNRCTAPGSPYRAWENDPTRRKEYAREVLKIELIKEKK